MNTVKQSAIKANNPIALSTLPQTPDNLKLVKMCSLTIFIQNILDNQHLCHTRPMVKRIISGGQTGVDRAGLDVAMRLGMGTGGCCPANRLAEGGAIPDRYDTLTETRSSSFKQRAGLNVRDSDATLMLNSGSLEGGTELTVAYARGQKKPYLMIQLDATPSITDVADWLQEVNPDVLNIAGPRESCRPGIYSLAYSFLLGLFQ